MARHRDLTPDEARLWHRIASTVRPLRTPPPVAVTAPAEPAATGPGPPAAPAPAPAKAKAKDGDGAGDGARDGAARPTPAPRHPPGAPGRTAPLADASGHKRVRRGQVDIGARIDLHGMTQTAALAALAAFVTRCRSDNMRAVLVVTGKGRPVDPGEDYITPQPGVIRRRLPEWLGDPAIRPHVAGYAQANPRHGGAGAYYVLLKARA